MQISGMVKKLTAFKNLTLVFRSKRKLVEWQNNSLATYSVKPKDKLSLISKSARRSSW